MRAPANRHKKKSVARTNRIMKAKAPKMIENTKKMMFLRGTKASQVIQDVLKDLSAIKRPHAKNLTRKNEIRPFENFESLEFLSEKNDAALFAFGSHSKKRPHNLIMGRMFDHQMLDMLEFTVSNYQGIHEFKDSIGLGLKPMFIFKGSLFDNDPKYKELKSLFLDTFRGEVFKKVSLNGLDWVITVTIDDETEKIFLRPYKVLLKTSGTKLPRVELADIGPRFDLALKRTHFAAPEIKKLSLKKPKGLVEHKQKNVSRNAFGEKVGQLHMKRQDFNTMQTRKMKGLKLSRSNFMEDNSNAAEEE